MPWPIRIVDHWPDEPSIGDAWQTSDTQGNTRWLICLPNGTLWDVYGPSSDGTPWNVSGELPNITVTPSIFPQPVKKPDGTLYRQGYHGWITSGVISDDIEGRTYPDKPRTF